MSYTISLDAIDLKYLPITTYSTGHHTKPLYDLTSARKHDYIKFEIVPCKKNVENNNGTIPPHRTTICHICNVTIPACCLIEHNQSDKHKMYKAVTDNALERLKRYINENKIECDVKNVSDKYFCNICCVILLKSHREKHEQSQIHCKRLGEEKQIKEFLSLYSFSVLTEESNVAFLCDTMDTQGMGSNKTEYVLDDSTNVASNLTEPEVTHEKPKTIQEKPEIIQGNAELESKVEQEVKTKVKRKKNKKAKSVMKHTMSTEIKSKSEISQETVKDPKLILGDEPKVISVKSIVVDEVELNVISEGEPKMLVDVESKIPTEEEPSIETGSKIKAKKTPKRGTTEVELEQANPSLKESIIKIPFADGKIVNVPGNHYHGFISASKDITVCLLCKNLIEDTLCHKTLAQEHLKMIGKAIEDINCLQQETESIIIVSSLGAAILLLFLLLFLLLVVLLVQLAGVKSMVREMQATGRIRVQKLKMNADKNHAFHNPGLVPDEELSRRGFSMHQANDVETGRYSERYVLVAHDAMNFYLD